MKNRVAYKRRVIRQRTVKFSDSLGNWYNLNCEVVLLASFKPHFWKLAWKFPMVVIRKGFFASDFPKSLSLNGKSGKFILWLSWEPLKCFKVTCLITNLKFKVTSKLTIFILERCAEKTKRAQKIHNYHRQNEHENQDTFVRYR